MVVTGEQPDATPEAPEADAEELGLSAAMAAVVQAVAPPPVLELPDPVSASTRNGHARATTWPDVPGVFFPEPFIVDNAWADGVPSLSMDHQSVEVDPEDSLDDTLRDAVMLGGKAPVAADSDQAQGEPRVGSDEWEFAQREPLDDFEREPTYIDLEEKIDDDEPERTLELDLDDLDEVVSLPAKTVESAPEPPPVDPWDEPTLEYHKDSPADATVESEPALESESAEAADEQLELDDIEDVEDLSSEVIEAPEAQAAPPVPRDASSGSHATIEGEARVMPLVVGRQLGLRPALAAPRFEFAKGFSKDGGGARPTDGWFNKAFDENYLESLPDSLRKQSRMEARFAQDALRLRKGAHILDVGCGFARHAIELAKRGYEVTGLDRSELMLGRAQFGAEKAGTSLTLVLADMRELAEREVYDAAILMGQSFGYFDDRGNLEVLQRVHQALKPRGRLLLEVMNRDRVLNELPRSTWWQRSGRLYLDESEADYEQSRLCVKRTIIFDDGRTPVERYLDIRLYGVHELQALLTMAGFRCAQISGSYHHRGVFFPRESRLMIALAERL